MGKDPNATVRRILRRESRRLPVTLSTDELVEKARIAATLSYEIKALAATAEGFKTQAKNLATTQDVKSDQRELILEQIRLRQEEREVPVQVEFDPRTRNVQEVRCDTNAVINERGLTQDETQATLFEEIRDIPMAPEPGEVDVTPPSDASLPSLPSYDDEEDMTDG